MVGRDNLKNGIVLGAILGFVLATPAFTVWFTDFLNSVLPVSAYVFGDFSLSVFGIIIGAGVGWLIDKY